MRLGLGMGYDPAFLHSAFATGYTFKQSYTLPELVEAFDIDQICAWDAVLSNQDRLPILHQL
jgi:hypothetical protein